MGGGERVFSGGIQGRGGMVSERVLAVAGMFGLGVERDEGREVLFEGVKVPTEAGSVVLITGRSGCGKSTLLRMIEGRLRAEGEGAVVRLEEIGVEGERALVDCFGCSLEEALGHLARAGLSDARVLMRRPGELSEGQRFRYRLAQFFAGDGRYLVADEFGATLDRVTAKVVAWQLGKFVRGSVGTGRPRSVFLATTQGDLGADLGGVEVRL